MVIVGLPQTVYISCIFIWCGGVFTGEGEACFVVRMFILSWAHIMQLSLLVLFCLYLGICLALIGSIINSVYGFNILSRQFPCIMVHVIQRKVLSIRGCKRVTDRPPSGAL